MPSPNQIERAFIRGFCAALREMENSQPGRLKNRVKRSADSIGITIRKAKASGVEEFDLETLRAAGVEIFQMKSGTHFHKKGYPRLSAGPCRNKYVHILIAEGMLGRALKKDEHVHHIDGNTKNPRWTNLLVLGESVHNAVSSKQYWYLKQKYSRERAAWWAYFDVTGETPIEGWNRQSQSLLVLRAAQTSFDTSVM